VQTRRVVITGIGVVSPIGVGRDAFWSALAEGKSGISGITLFDASGLTTRIAGEVRGEFVPQDFPYQKQMRWMDRFTQFAVVAAAEALADSGLDLEKEDTSRIGCLVGSGIGGLTTLEEQHKKFLERGPSRISPFFIPMLIIDMASGQISILWKLRGPNLAVATACATGSHAVGESFSFIVRGDADVMVTGGSEAAITALGIGGFCAMKALSSRNDEPSRASRPFDKDRDGFVMGEGAGIVILEELERARARGAHVYGEMLGYGATGDGFHMTGQPDDGEGIVRAMRMAFGRAGLAPEAVGYVNAHGTSTQLNDVCETRALKAAFGGHARSLPVSSTKSMTGHMLGAAGGVELIACLMALERGVLPPTINLDEPDPECDLDYVPNEAREASVDVAMSNSMGFGGHNASLIVGRLKG